MKGTYVFWKTCGVREQFTLVDWEGSSRTLATATPTGAFRTRPFYFSRKNFKEQDWQKPIPAAYFE